MKIPTPTEPPPAIARPVDGNRIFAPGDIRFAVLKLISEEPSHGYKIAKAIQHKLRGAYSPSSGVLYPTLKLLEQLGYILGERAEGKRKIYSVTARGQAILVQNQEIVEALFRRTGTFIACIAMIDRHDNSIVQWKMLN